MSKRTRLKKYLVYNPKKDKPEKYFASFEKAYEIAKLIRDKEKEDVLVLKVVGIAENDKSDRLCTKELNSAMSFARKLFNNIIG